MAGHYPKRVLFVYPGIAYIGYDSFERSLGGSDSDPIYGFTLLAGVIAEKGYTYEFVDLRQLKNEDELVQKLKQSDAPFAAITVQTPSFDIACRVASLAKSTGKITIAGGVHATVAPEDFEDNPAWDYVVLGEGEVAFGQLLDDLVNGKARNNVVPGEILNHLDDLPLPHLFREWDPCYRDSYAIEIARGCPGRCTYCVSGERKFYKKMRFRSPDHVLRELDHVYDRYRFRHLLFLDVCASTRPKFFTALLTKLLERYAHLDITTQDRVDSFNDEVAHLLSRFNNCMVWFGFESASPRILKFIGKHTTPEQGMRAAELCHKYNLDIGANVLIGIPTETNKEIQQTYDFIKSIKPKMLFCNILSPFPGTQIHHYCKDNGILPELDTHERYELRHVLEKGFIKGIDYERIRYWHWMFNRLIDLDSRAPWQRIKDGIRSHYLAYRLLKKLSL
jgi:anaerobic magnesium-protoporphyrin IX monomethyl ester cyclase